MLKQGPDFHIEISGYSMSEVEITRVGCIRKGPVRREKAEESSQHKWVKVFTYDNLEDVYI